MVKNIALIPDAVAKAAVPPSSAQTLSSKTCTVGLEYDYKYDHLFLN